MSKPLKVGKFEKGLVYYMLRLYGEEKMGCVECGETTEGSSTTKRYVWVVTKPMEVKYGEKDELDVYCPGCWEKEVD